MSILASYLGFCSFVFHHITTSILATFLNFCSSTTFFSSQREPTDEGNAFVNLHKELRVSRPLIIRPRDQELDNLLRRKKLYLVLDLDHTLLHTIYLADLSTEERNLFVQMDGFPDSVITSLHIIDGYMMTKLRPFVHSFLKEASELFDMYICTLGIRAYALNMAKLLDPDNVYFDNYSKVIAREDCPGKDMKSLDVFLRNKDPAVVILDDIKEVWVTNKRNVIEADRYEYFEASNMEKNLKSYSVSKTDESERTGTLATALEVLRHIHAEFFDVADQNKDLEQQDVRNLLNAM